MKLIKLLRLFGYRLSSDGVMIYAIRERKSKLFKRNICWFKEEFEEYDGKIGNFKKFLEII